MDGPEEEKLFQLGQPVEKAAKNSVKDRKPEQIVLSLSKSRTACLSTVSSFLRSTWQWARAWIGIPSRSGGPHRKMESAREKLQNTDAAVALSSLEFVRVANDKYLSRCKDHKLRALARSGDSRQKHCHIAKLNSGYRAGAPDLFQVDMIIVQHGNSVGLPPTTSRRCLLDTGAEINMISSKASEGLSSSFRQLPGTVYGIGGHASYEGTMDIVWRFRPDRPVEETKKLTIHYEGTFYVLPPEPEPIFDCILGRPWIQEHINFFLELLTERNASAT